MLTSLLPSRASLHRTLRPLMLTVGVPTHRIDVLPTRDSACWCSSHFYSIDWHSTYILKLIAKLRCTITMLIFNDEFMTSASLQHLHWQTLLGSGPSFDCPVCLCDRKHMCLIINFRMDKCMSTNSRRLLRRTALARAMLSSPSHLGLSLLINSKQLMLMVRVRQE